MAFDGFFTAALADELDKLSGARVDKLFFSDNNTLFLQIYAAGSRQNLLISVAPSHPVIALTEQIPLKPDDPGSLCMLFRKHLSPSRLRKVERVGEERILRFSFDSADELGFVHEKRLYAEVMGKFSNLILCDERDKVLGAASLTDITSPVRQVFPGGAYTLPPPQDKQSLSTVVADEQAFLLLAEANSTKKADRFLLDAILCFSPLLARELVFRVCGRTDALVEELNARELFRQLCGLQGILEQKKFAPHIVKDDNGLPIAFSFLPILQYGNSEAVGSFSELLTRFFSSRAENDGKKQSAADILALLKTALARERRKADLQRNELAECKERDVFRLEGDLLTANLYRIKQGQTSVGVLDYETGEERILTLDPRLTPSKNAQNRYKKYTKLKHAEQILVPRLRDTEARIDYLLRVSDFVTRADSVAELDELRAELAETGYITAKPSKNKRKRERPKPLVYTTPSGYHLRVGRNNKENDILRGESEGWDIWFHIKGFHGSHVFMQTNGDEPPAEDYTYAASIAAYYSEKRGSRNIGVDYTHVRNLKKPKGSPPGFVVYETYWTAFVDADLGTLPQSTI